MAKRKAKKQTVVQGHKGNFDTLKRAFDADHVCLVEAFEPASGKVVAVIAAVQHDPNGGVVLVPFARMFHENPYDEWEPPAEGGGFVKITELGEVEDPRLKASKALDAAYASADAYDRMKESECANCPDREECAEKATEMETLRRAALKP